MRSLQLFLVMLLMHSCDQAEKKDLCDRYFEPYPDLISTRLSADPMDTAYVNAMRHYSAGEFDRAANGLSGYIQQRGFEKSAHLYLGMCLLAMDLPYDAELQFDHLENSRVKDFRDQTEWYTLLCWVCSEQNARAHTEARRIAAAEHHTYKKAATQLADDLDRTLTR